MHRFAKIPLHVLQNHELQTPNLENISPLSGLDGNILRTKASDQIMLPVFAA